MTREIACTNIQTAKSRKLLTFMGNQHIDWKSLPVALSVFQEDMWLYILHKIICWDYEHGTCVFLEYYLLKKKQICKFTSSLVSYLGIQVLGPLLLTRFAATVSGASRRWPGTGSRPFVWERKMQSLVPGACLHLGNESTGSNIFPSLFSGVSISLSGVGESCLFVNI